MKKTEEMFCSDAERFLCLLFSDMARGNLFPSHFPERFCLFAFREEAEKISRAKLCIRVGNERLSASFDFHKDCVR